MKFQNAWQMVFVSGASGFLGSHLIYHLLKQKSDTIRILTRRSEDETMEILENTFSFYEDEVTAKELQKLTFVEGDILNIESLETAMAGIDEVYHAAAMVSFNKNDKQKIITNNVDGTANIVNEAIKSGVRKFCHFSSIASLGKKSKNQFIDEETYLTEFGGRTTYSKSKFLSEMEVWRGIAEGLTAVIVNPSIILGPGNWDAGSPRLFSKIWKGLNFYTKGVTGYVDVRDVCTASIRLMDSENAINQRFVLSAANVSYQELFGMISEKLRKENPKKYATPLLTNIAWRADALKSFITRSSPTLTKETANVSHSKSFYSSEKIENTIGFQFYDIEETIEFAAHSFLRQKVNNL